MQYSNYSAICTYGPFLNNVLLNLFHYFYPVYYGDWALYKPKVGSLRECLETRITVSVESPVLLRSPFQATTSREMESCRC